MSQLLTLCLLLLTRQGGEKGYEGRIKPRNTEIHSSGNSHMRSDFR